MQWNVLDVFDVQLTDNVTLSTAGAVQRFLTSCRAAILQQNSRSVAEAVSDASRSVFELSNSAEEETLQRINCPLCPIPNQADSECCDNGECHNGTCVCDEGMYTIPYLKV